jgi:hypothetical protein
MYGGFQIIRGPVPQDAGTPLLSLMQMFNISMILIAVFEKVPPDVRFQKRADCTVSLAEDQTRVTCKARSGASCSAIVRNGSELRWGYYPPFV